jgi:hypothetical protein
MEDLQQTAVSWLIENIHDIDQEVFDHALKMERQQMIEAAWVHGNQSVETIKEWIDRKFV